MTASDRDPLEGPRKAALAVVVAAGKVLFLAAFLPALDACDRTWVPARGFVSGDDAFMLPPHIIGLIAALAGVLFWRRWSARMRALEIGLVALAALVTLALGALCLALLVSLFARAQMSRWRAARALVVLGLDCAIWYFFWLTAFSLADGEDAVRYGTWVAAGASVLLFAAARRLEGTVRRWRPRPPGGA